MRFAHIVLSALTTLLAVSPAFSQSMPVCTGAAPLAPADGSHFIGTRPIMFQWSGEPKGTASRELHLAALDGTETVVPLDGRYSDTVKVKMTGDLAWVVVFLDAEGQPICVTPAGLLSKGPGGGKVTLAGDSLSGQSAGAGAPAKVSVYMNNGRLVIVLQNSPYTGPYTKLVAADEYDGRTEDLQGASGLEIHGNNQKNKIYGSAGPDLIFAYGDSDFVNPQAGIDVLDMGTYGVEFDAVNIADGGEDFVIAEDELKNDGTPADFPSETADWDGGLIETITTN